ncbi:EamA family transporter [Protaetiibacter intestinalis]|uniref:EamA domain-containing protein n=1 Tax=Protaetiibacter intestinalis TaxID=2419774 RepID=A0A387BAB4_9MICO|nr:EamA family transporter [Protaetiibacter intestinalis]AYF98076.1 hypothetical protein D7I47_07280 [Protaetiibacter intestinalis]
MSVEAVLLVLGAAVSHAAWNVLAHRSSGGGMLFLWGAAVSATVLWAPLIPLTGGIPTEQLGGFLLGIGVSGVLHVAYMLVLQRGYALGNLSTVYATARGTGPLLTVIVAIAVLGERPAPFALAGVLAIVVGVVALGIVDRPPALPGSRRRIDPALVAGALTGVSIAAYTLWDAHAIRSWQIPPVAFMVGCTFLEIPLYTLALRSRTREAVRLLRERWRTMLAFGILSPLSYILVLTAVTIAPVSLVAPMREVSVVLVSLFGALVLREGNAMWRVASAGVVVTGVLLIAL